MREREEEIRNIHKGMHTVNEIYKDLAHLVDNQQEGVDQIEDQMENAKDNTASGLKHIEKANEASSSQCVISWLIAIFGGRGSEREREIGFSQVGLLRICINSNEFKPKVYISDFW